LDDVQRFVSREHTAIWWQDARYVIEDRGSTRGTYVNGRRLTGQQRLGNGDEIRLGSYILIFQELVFDEDMEMTRIEPSSAFVQDDTRNLTKTDTLKEKKRRAGGSGGAGRS
jgi:pSer/pThr/pTyr-binding forkhead associated (FHA) protein